MSKPDIFKPYLVLEKIHSAGIVKLYGGGYCNNTCFEVIGGAPYQAAYNESFKLAVIGQIPLWEPMGFNWTCLYHPDVKALEVAIEKPAQEA